MTNTFAYIRDTLKVIVLTVESRLQSKSKCKESFVFGLSTLLYGRFIDSAEEKVAELLYERTNVFFGDSCCIQSNQLFFI